MTRSRTLLPTLATLAVFAWPAAAADDGTDFFEAKVRPVLVEHCTKCHSADAAKAGKLKGGLRLDTAAGLLKGGDSGPAVVPGKPKDGTLLASVRYDGDTQMPPKGQLPPAVVADLEKWVAMGAPDPRTDAPPAGPAAVDVLDRARGFWSFQPPTAVSPPPTPYDGWAKTETDRYIAAKWVEHGLTPVGPADKRTQIRRVTFDLTGLPPTQDDIRAFEADGRPEAFTEVVDRLLASEHFGERWARHWLDVARYAEDQAHTFSVKPKKSAFQYRDWVVRAFNADMPFDQFARLQIAGDMVPEADGDPFTRLAGLGLLGLGAEYYKNTAAAQAVADELDDRVDTVTRGFLGLTVSCARCHDHKFDPIPTRDYYGLAGVFNGFSPAEVPLAPAADVKRYDDVQKAIKEQDDKGKAVVADAGTAAAWATVPHTAKYLAAVRKVAAAKKAGGKGDVADRVAKADGLDPFFLARWAKFLESSAAKKLPALTGWLTLPTDADAAKVATAAEAVQTAVAAATAGPEKKKGEPAALLKAMQADAGPLAVPPGDAEKRFLSDADKARLAAMRADLDRLRKASPPAYPTAHVIKGGGKQMRVYVRGNVAKPGDPAPKGFLQALAGPAAKSGEGYTRLDLADAIASPDNPLTARVIVNRVWERHFGRGLVATPSNFGKLGDRPSHPELLDSLAVRFVQHGWSLKWLHREIVLSATYQLASTANAEDEARDVGNVYLWRASRRRLDVEAWRDSLLAVAGTLDPAVGGPTFNLSDANARRRTVYAKVSRHDLDGLLRLFDFPDANVTSDRRTVTTVPQQQLFALNSEFMVGQAKAFAARVGKAAATDADRVTAAYRLAYGRDPSDAEQALGTAFLAGTADKADQLTRWQQYAQVLLASNEFLYID